MDKDLILPLVLLIVLLCGLGVAIWIAVDITSQQTSEITTEKYQAVESMTNDYTKSYILKAQENGEISNGEYDTIKDRYIAGLEQPQGNEDN